MSPEKNKSHEEDHSEISIQPREEDEKMKEGENISAEGKEGDGSSSGRKEEEEEEEAAAREKNSEEKQEDPTKGATNTESQEEEKIKETASQRSVR